MKPTILTFLICFLGLSYITTCNAQKDPFGQTPSNKEDVTASPSELSDFKDYRTNPDNIKISSILTKELATTLQAEDKKQVTIIDARSKKEYDVSHINHSKRIGYEDFSIQRVWMVPRDAQIVIYSTNKNRSTTVAQYLTLIGFSNIQVLGDGLIGWKNGKNDVYDANGTTNKIHVGTKDNVKLVKSGLAVY